MRYSIPAVAAMAGLLWAACASKEQPKRTPAQEAERIAAAFETPKPYTHHKLDSLDLERFLAANPQYRQDSSQIRSFYASRGYQYAWFAADTLAPTAEAMLNLLEPTGALQQLHTWRALVERAQADTMLADSARLNVELGLTGLFFQAASNEFGGYVKGDLHDLGWYIPRAKKNYAMLLDSMVAGKTDLSPIEPVHPQYHLLKVFLQRYYQVEAEGPWPVIALPKGKLAMGDTLAALQAIGHRLFLLGDLAADPSGNGMDTTLAKGLVNFQERHGLSPSGLPDAPTMAALNVPIAQRIRTILLNMERLRWVNPVPPRDYLLVNIPEFRLHVYEGGKEAWSMKVVAGAVATHTVIFSGELSTIVFSPYWNVPQSIVRNEVAPAMRRNAGYLARNNMEVVRDGKVVPPGSINWAHFTGGGGYSFRQKPGTENSLGLVKFLFPNEYSIYMHDTPAKARFVPEKRAFSHGCIRLQEPQRLAEYLLRNDSTWTSSAIGKAMHAGKEQAVKVQPPVPVVIGYFTAWVDGQGRLNFRDDVYGHDARLAEELFAPETIAADAAASTGGGGARLSR
ncbi:MAG: L,D-transpeptidase family protein [Bacteroidetes bacterium]|nr:L,D-transpeptidase family protein [Bacteroidota bacterium]